MERGGCPGELPVKPQPTSGTSASGLQRRPRVGIIGISGYARLLLKSLLATLETEPGSIVAATVINRAQEEEMCRYLESRGCEIYSDYREMLQVWSGQLDLCLVPVSIHWHAPICVDALHAGINVLVEKPLAGDLADAHAIIEASRISGKFVAVGFQDMYSPPNWDIKRFAHSQRLGRLREIHITGSWPRSENYYSRNDWAGRATCDGRAVYDSPLSNAFAHHLNLGLFFAASTPGEPACLAQIEGRLLRHFPIETFDTAALQMSTSEGVALQCYVTHADALAREPEILMEFENGHLRWAHAHQAVAQTWDGSVVEKWLLCTGELNRRHMLREVLACAGGEGLPHCTAEFALSHVRAIEYLHRQIEILDHRMVAGSAIRSNPWEPLDNVFSGLKEPHSVKNMGFFPAVLGRH